MRRAKTWRTWTAKELRRLEALRLEGWSAWAIARELGRTEASVKCRLSQEGLTKPRTRAAAWLQALAVARPIRATAALMGVSHWAVKQAARKLRRAGWPVPKVRRPRSASGATGPGSTAATRRGAGATSRPAAGAAAPGTATPSSTA